MADVNEREVAVNLGSPINSTEQLEVFHKTAHFLIRHIMSEFQRHMQESNQDRFKALCELIAEGEEGLSPPEVTVRRLKAEASLWRRANPGKEAEVEEK